MSFLGQPESGEKKPGPTVHGSADKNLTIAPCTCSPSPYGDDVCDPAAHSTSDTSSELLLRNSDEVGLSVQLNREA